MHATVNVGTIFILLLLLMEIQILDFQKKNNSYVKIKAKQHQLLFFQGVGKQWLLHSTLRDILS